MKVILTPKESEKIFYDSLCNAVGTGYMQGYGIELVCEDSDYDKAEKALIEQGISPCIEDIWMQILRSGGTLTFKDIEGEKENTKSVTLKEVHEKVCNCSIQILCNFNDENDDVNDADAVLQTVFYGEMIFG